MIAEIVATLPDEIIRPALEYPGIRQLIDTARSHRGKVQKIAEP
jgi:hypothetical protein